MSRNPTARRIAFYGDERRGRCVAGWWEISGGTCGGGGLPTIRVRTSRRYSKATMWWHCQVTIVEKSVAAVRPPLSEPIKTQLSRPTATRRMQHSEALLSIADAPSVVYTHRCCCSDAERSFAWSYMFGAASPQAGLPFSLIFGGDANPDTDSFSLV